MQKTAREKIKKAFERLEEANYIALPTSVCLLFVEENSSPLLKQQLPELEGFRDS